MYHFRNSGEKKTTQFCYFLEASSNLAPLSVNCFSEILLSNLTYIFKRQWWYVLFWSYFKLLDKCYLFSFYAYLQHSSRSHSFLCRQSFVTSIASFWNYRSLSRQYSVFGESNKDSNHLYKFPCWRWTLELQTQTKFSALCFAEATAGQFHLSAMLKLTDIIPE